VPKCTLGYTLDILKLEHIRDNRHNRDDSKHASHFIKNKLTYGKTNETVAGIGFSDRGWMMNGKGTLHISK
jgi:hypothetical protein